MTITERLDELKSMVECDEITYAAGTALVECLKVAVEALEYYHDCCNCKSEYAACVNRHHEAIKSLTKIKQKLGVE